MALWHEGGAAGRRVAARLEDERLGQAALQDVAAQRRVRAVQDQMELAGRILVFGGLAGAGRERARPHPLAGLGGRRTIPSG